jgi:FtsH-binding integral membrane protein
MPPHRIAGVAILIGSILLMRVVNRRSAAPGGATTTAEILIVAAIFGLTSGLAVLLYDPKHFWNPPVPFADKLLYWGATIFAALAAIRILFRVSPLGRKLLTLLLGVAIAVAVSLGLAALRGTPP